MSPLGGKRKPNEGPRLASGQRTKSLRDSPQRRARCVPVIGCQRSIGQKIIDKKADYVLALKGNQSSLREDVEMFATEQKVWIMDMTFRDDESRIRKDHAPANFTTLKHIAYNLIRTAPGKDSLRLKRKVAAWDDAFLAGLVTA
jgi:predicted transposase YbfD/YdcC